MNTKRFLAVALSTAMVFGSTLTAFATELDPTAASGTGTGTGAGSSAGYVDTTITKVYVPTQESVTAGIAFKVDPQGLIAGTDAAAYNGYKFPESEDTGVYFQTGAKEFANESETFYVANEGTGDVTFTIKVEPVANASATDIAFDSKANATSATDAVKLYIGAIIGKDATPTAVGSAVEKKAVLEAVSDNFDFTYGTDGYGFEAKSGSKWNAVPIKFEGAVTQLDVDKSDLFKDKTVPGIKLTYSWAAKTDGDTTTGGVTIDDEFDDSSSAAANYIAAASVSTSSKTVSFSAGEGVTVSGVVINLNGSDTTLVKGNHYSVSGNNITFNKYASSWAGGTITVTFSDGKTDTLICQ